MAKSQHQKELIASYKERRLTGGVYTITNTQTGKLLLQSGLDLPGFRNRFAFTSATGSCVYGKLTKDWRTYGPGSFRFDILEEAEQKEDQSADDFRSDLAAMEELWRETLLGQGKELY